MPLLFETYLPLSLLMLSYMSAWFVVSLIVKRSDVADVAWGLGPLAITSLILFVSGIPLLFLKRVCPAIPNSKPTQKKQAFFFRGL